MINLDHHRLRGPVHTCQIQRTWYSRPGGGEETNQHSNTTFLEFRPDGSLAHSRHGNPDGAEWITTYEYNQSGLLSRTRTGNSAGQANLTFYEYDHAA